MLSNIQTVTMKQDNTNNRVDRGWAKLQPELDKAFPPKKKIKIFPWFFLVATVIAISYVTLTRNKVTTKQNFASEQSLVKPMATEENKVQPIQDSKESPINNTPKTIKEYNNDRATTISKPSNFSAQDTELIAQLPQTTSTANNSTLANQSNHTTSNLINEKRIPQVLRPQAQENFLDSELKGTVQSLTQTLALSQSATHKSGSPTIETKQASVLGSVMLPTLAQSEMPVPSRSEIVNHLTQVKVIQQDLQSIQFNPIVVNQIVYNINNNISTEILAGGSISNQSWVASLSLGGGYRIFTQGGLGNNLNQIEINAQLEAEDGPSMDTNPSSGIFQTGRPSLSRNTFTIGNLYGVGQVSIGYKISNWIFTGQFGGEYNRLNENLNVDNNAFGASTPLITINNFGTFVGGQIAYALDQNIDLGIGYRRNLSNLFSERNQLTLGLGVRI